MDNYIIHRIRRPYIIIIFFLILYLFIGGVRKEGTPDD